MMVLYFFFSIIIFLFIKFANADKDKSEDFCDGSKFPNHEVHQPCFYIVRFLFLPFIIIFVFRLHPLEVELIKK